MYVATVARTYRKALDDIMKKIPNCIKRIWSGIKRKSGNVPTGNLQRDFIMESRMKDEIYDNNTYVKNYTYLGSVNGMDEKGFYRIEQRNKFSVGETIEIMKPDGRNIQTVVREIRDEDGNRMESAPHPKQVLYVDMGTEMEEYDILRRKE